MKYVVMGADFGTDSVRIILADAETGEVAASAVSDYPRWEQGLFCDARNHQFRQHPLDYIESFQQAVARALEEAPRHVQEKIRGIGIDTTGSTPVAVDEKGTPLGMKKKFINNPNAMFILWKDHTAVKEAHEINTLARTWNEDYTRYEGGVYSAEWFWSKILHIIRKDHHVRREAFSWIEHCDWMTAWLTGNTDPLRLKRSRCAAGHKAMWHPSWGGLPGEPFLEQLDPLLKGIRNRLYVRTFTSDVSAGSLDREIARKTGIPQGTQIAVGAFDAHLGAVGAGITPGQLCKVMGTSTCDMLVAEPKIVGNRLIRGICGQVDGSILPGMIGMEAGQSAFGDVYAWFRDLLLYPLRQILKEPGDSVSINSDEAAESIISGLSRDAEALPPGAHGLIALDWLNGRRTPDADQRLKAAIAGLHLGTDAPAVFRALVEATAFGARAIVQRFQEEGVPIKGIIALGGVARKSPFVMQVTADVLNMPIRVVREEQAVALGSAMAASVAAGIHPTMEAAQKVMTSGFEREYHPRQKFHAVYDDLYRRYCKLGGWVESSLEEK